MGSRAKGLDVVTFVEALDAVTKKHPATPAAKACIDALSKAKNLSAELPTLHKLHKGLCDEYADAPEGALVVACLLAGKMPAVTAWATLIAPDVWRAYSRETADRKAKLLYADCFLALGAWVKSWNRRALKRVA